VIRVNGAVHRGVQRACGLWSAAGAALSPRPIMKLSAPTAITLTRVMPRVFGYLAKMPSRSLQPHIFPKPGYRAARTRPMRLRHMWRTPPVPRGAPRIPASGAPKHHTRPNASAAPAARGELENTLRVGFMRCRCRPVHSGPIAFALCCKRTAGTSNLPVWRSYLQRQPCTVRVWWSLMSASPERVMSR
jgi:hypothetical protein